MRVAKAKGNIAGRREGAKIETKKSISMKDKIKKLSKDFEGTLKDTEVMELLGIARNTYYKYKKEVIYMLGFFAFLLALGLIEGWCGVVVGVALWINISFILADNIAWCFIGHKRETEMFKEDIESRRAAIACVTVIVWAVAWWLL